MTSHAPRKPELAISRFSALLMLPCLLGLGLGCNSSSSGFSGTRPSGTGSAEIGGSVSGLTGELALRLNGDEELVVMTNGAFTFLADLDDGDRYSVTVAAQPAQQLCVIDPSTSAGNFQGEAVTDIVIDCENAASVSGVASGVRSPFVLRLTNGMEEEDLVIGEDGPFAFVDSVTGEGDFSVEIATQPSAQRCEVTGGTGSIAAGDLANIAVDCATGVRRMAIVVSETEGTIQPFALDAESGGLSAAGAGASVSGALTAVALHPSGRFVVATDRDANQVLSYSVDPFSAELSVVGSASTGGTSPAAIAIDPTGRFVYVAHDGSNSIAIFALNHATGALTQVGTPVGAGLAPVGLAAHPSGRFVYAVNRDSDSVSQFAVDTTTGTLSVVGEAQSVGASPASIAVGPLGRSAYVANAVDETISVFSIDSATGVLSATGSAVAAAPSPVAVTVGPARRFVYVSHDGAGAVGGPTGPEISTYAIEADTGLIEEVGARVATAVSPGPLVIDATRQFGVIAGAVSGDLTTYSISTETGALTEVGITSADAGAVSVAFANPFELRYPEFLRETRMQVLDPATGELSLVGVGTEARSVVFEPAGRFGYGADRVVIVDPETGVLVSGPELPFERTAAPLFDPTGRFLYQLASNPERISTFAIDEEAGALGALETFSLNRTWESRGVAVVDPAGRFIYVSGSGASPDSVERLVISVDPESGLPSAVEATPDNADIPIFQFAPEPSGRFLFAPSGFNSVQTFSVDSITGALTELQTATVPQILPFFAQLHPTGRFLYVRSAADWISAFRIDPATGALTQTGEPIRIFSDDVGPAFDFDSTGRFLFADFSVDIGPPGTAIFEVDLATGALSGLSRAVYEEFSGED
ncbi:MAG: beta-propeller fold lactonase family protein [Myxococcota bacterium]